MAKVFEKSQLPIKLQKSLKLEIMSQNGTEKYVHLGFRV
jgi:hypothetical protein